MHKLTFYPLGNADTCFIEVENERLLILDYAHVKNVNDRFDSRWDIETDLRAKLKTKNRTDVDVFCITHIDRDHVCRACEFFHLESNRDCQGEGRIKIKELWVPAGAITEESVEDDARIWRQEARKRLRDGKGVRVFGRPQRLKDWLQKEGLSLENRGHLITDAGNVIPGFSLDSDSLEFFLHSPHGHRINEREVEDRNQDCVVMQAVFRCGSQVSKVIFAGDAPWEALEDIAQITKNKGRPERLEYALHKLSHHCSYKSLNSPENKGETKTLPRPDIDDWFRRGTKGAWLISSSDRILDEDQPQPPHFQAKNYYLDIKDLLSGKFLVTMEEPNVQTPKPILIRIDQFGISRDLALSGGLAAVSVINERPPQAG